MLEGEKISNQPAETPEGNSEKERQIETFMKPLRELVACETFRSYGSSTCWYVTIEWSESTTDKDGMMEWKKFDAVGTLDERFLDYAHKHYEYWVEKALVPINIKKIEYLPDRSLNERQSW